MQEDERLMLGRLLERTEGLDKKFDEWKQEIRIHLGKIELSLSAEDRRQEERVKDLEGRVEKLEDTNLLAEGGRKMLALLTGAAATVGGIIVATAQYLLSPPTN